MNEFDKQLLINELCSRLPYGVKCQIYSDDDDDVFTEELESVNAKLICNQIVTSESVVSIESVKPYLRPMSSMTESEEGDYNWFCSYHPLDEYIAIDFVDWLNEHHFDYRDLIEKGLALEAPDDMYKTNNN